MSTNTVNIVVIGDRMVDVGLHVTLYSLLEKSSFEFHKIYYITEGFNSNVSRSLRKSLAAFEDSYSLEIIEHDGNAFIDYKGLHGNTFTYSKLLISELVDCECALYLDIDVVVNMDIKKLQPYFEKIDSYLIMANPERSLNQCLEKEFLIDHLEVKNKMYYNAGVLLLNLKKWRYSGLSGKLASFADRYSSELTCADQTVINGVINEHEIGTLPDIFNYRLENYMPPMTYSNIEGILHFYGRPKPWDLWASRVHPHYKIFHNVLQKTAYKGYPFLEDITLHRIKKFLKTFKSYIKVVFGIRV